MNAGYALPYGTIQRQRHIHCDIAVGTEYWVEAFLGLEIVSQLALAFLPIQSWRPALRCLSYAASLGLLAFLPGKSRLHPAAKAGAIVLIIVGLSIFHPTTNSLLAGAAQIAMYLAILAPLFWASRLPIDTVKLRRVVLMIWAFHTASS